MQLLEIALKRSFFYPSNEIYSDSYGGFYDYGPVGVLLKHKIENLWKMRFLKEEGFFEVESSIITPESVLIASGHVKSFADPIIECENCKTKIRADTLVEEVHLDKHGEKWDGKLETIDKIVEEQNIRCPKCGGRFSKARMFNLMFKTGVGGDGKPAYCRPETAQGIFTSFLRIFRNHGTKLPLGIGQIGKSFRNEISPRQGLVRMREFTQMELEYFFDPEDDKYPKFEEVKNKKMIVYYENKEEELSAQEMLDIGLLPNEIMGYFLIKEWDFYKELGFQNMRQRVLAKEECPHYSSGNVDLEVKTSVGWIETIGTAYRTDFDLSQHAKNSKKNLEVFFNGRRFVPHVVEVSMGVDRLIYALLENSLREKSEEKQWVWFDFTPKIAPYEVALFPLLKKDNLPKKAREILVMLRKEGLDVDYRESGSIGRRYARADEIGTPYSITVDHQTLEDDTVTIRYRNDGKQERIKTEEILNRVKKNIEKSKVYL